MKRLFSMIIMLTVLTGCSASGNNTQLTWEDIADLNGGQLPEIEYRDDGYPHYIEGVISDFLIHNKKDASRAVRQLSGIIGAGEYDDLRLEEVHDTYVSYYTIYQFSHYHKGIRVYGDSVRLYADKETDEAIKLHNVFTPHMDIDIVPDIDAEHAAAIVAEAYPDITPSDEPVLMIYASEAQADLAWFIPAYDSDPYEIILDAHTGEVLYTESVLICE